MLLIDSYILELVDYIFIRNRNFILNIRNKGDICEIYIILQISPLFVIHVIHRKVKS